MLISYIRKNKILSSIFIGSIMAVFAGVPIIRLLETTTYKQYFFLKIGSTDISPREYDEEYRRLLNEYSNHRKKVKIKEKYLPAYVHREVLAKFLKKEGLKPLMREIGFHYIIKEEITDYVIEVNIKKVFTYKGKLYKKEMDNWLRDKKNRPALKILEKELREKLKETKLDHIVTNGYLITQADQKHLTSLESKEVTISYVAISDKNILKSSLPVVESQDKKDHLEKAQKEGKFQREEGIKAIYVVFEARPSKADEDVPREMLKERKNSFATIVKTNNKNRIIAFAKKYTDKEKDVVVKWKEDEIPRLIREQVKDGKKIIGPVAGKKGRYSLYGLVDKRKELLSNKMVYTFAVIEAHRKISNTTRVNMQGKAKAFAAGINSKKAFEAKAKQKEYAAMGIKTDELTILKKHAEDIGYDDPYHKIAYKLINDGKPNKPQVIEIDDNRYAVVMIVTKQKKGPLKLSEADKQVEEDIITEKKVAVIQKDIVNKKGNLISFEKIKKKYPEHTHLVKTKTVTAADNKLAHVGDCPEIVGGALAMKPGQVKVFTHKKGVVVIKCINQTKYPAKKVKEKVTKKAQKRKASITIKLKTLAINKKKKKVKDKRYIVYAR